MSELTVKRINFIETLHEAFLTHKGYGAYAYISVAEVMRLFDCFLNSEESSEIFIQRYIRSLYLLT